MLPSLFISHGAPTLLLDPSPAKAFLEGLSSAFPRPGAVLAISAHWDNAAPTVNRVSVNETIHDFYGFPEALYRMRYPAPGSPELAERTRALLAEAGFETAADEERGLDHGAWVPLMLMYPKADIPVVQLSIQTPRGPEHHLKMGEALKPLRDEGVLVLGTGGIVHNLRRLDRGRIDAPEPEWVRHFADWVHEALSSRRIADLLRYRAAAPFAETAHPEEDHFLPLFVALGAGGKTPDIERLHRSTTFGTLRMDAYAFT